MITIQTSKMRVYIGNTHLFGIPTSFSGDIDTLEEERVSYPWEGDVKPYTEKDAKKLAMSYIKGDISANRMYTDPENLVEFSQ